MAIKSLDLLFDCTDPLKLAHFWAAVLDYEVDKEANEEGAGINDPAGQKVSICFFVAPDAKVVKNRLHLDLVPTTTRAEEVERVVGLGATQLTVFENWTVLADPEGNEFCVLRGDVERN